MDKKARSILEGLSESNEEYEREQNAEEMVQVIEEVFMAVGDRETLEVLDDAWQDFFYRTLRRPAPRKLTFGEIKFEVEKITKENSYDLSHEYTKDVVWVLAFMDLCIGHALLTPQGKRQALKRYQRDFDRYLRTV